MKRKVFFETTAMKKAIKFAAEESTKEQVTVLKKAGFKFPMKRIKKECKHEWSYWSCKKCHKSMREIYGTWENHEKCNEKCKANPYSCFCKCHLTPSIKPSGTKSLKEIHKIVDEIREEIENPKPTKIEKMSYIRLTTDMNPDNVERNWIDVEDKINDLVDEINKLKLSH